MIEISLERAIEELVEMIFTENQRKVLVIGGRRNIARMYQHIICEIAITNNTYNLRHAFNYDCDKHINDCYSLCSVDFATTNDSHFRGRRYDLVLIDTQLDQKFHDEIRLSLRQNSVIPKEKQIQFFDIEQDKVWFEKEYQTELCKTFICEWAKLYYPNQAKQIKWIQKQLEEGYLYKNRMGFQKKREDAIDSMIMSRLAYDMTVATDKYIIEKLGLTKDKMEEEEMNNFAINFEVHKQSVPKITDIEIIVPDKVVKVFFEDGTDMKMVCHEEDTFDLRRCLFIAIAKKLYKDRYTWEGIEHKATELSYLKSATKVVDKALKDYNNKIKEAEKEAKKIADKKRAAENQKRKHAEYVKRRDERRQKEIDEKNRQQFEYDVAVQVEAARRIKEMNPEYQVEKFCDDFCNDWDGK